MYEEKFPFERRVELEHNILLELIFATRQELEMVEKLIRAITKEGGKRIVERGLVDEF